MILSHMNHIECNVTHLEHEELCVEVDERVEQDLGAVRAQLLRLPQVLLLNPATSQKYKIISNFISSIYFMPLVHVI